MIEFSADFWPDNHNDAQLKAVLACNEFFGETPYRITGMWVRAMHNGFGDALYYAGRVEAESIDVEQRPADMADVPCFRCGVSGVPLNAEQLCAYCAAWARGEHDDDE